MGADERLRRLGPLPMLLRPALLLALSLLPSAAVATAAGVAESASAGGQLAQASHARLRALSALSGKRRSWAGRRARAAGGDDAKPETAELVRSLEQVVKSLEKEQDAAKALATSREKQCKADLDANSHAKKAIKSGERIVAQAEDDLREIDAAVTGLRSTIGGLESQIKDTNTKIAQLTQNLKDLRAKKKKAQTQSAASLQELDAVIARTSRMQEQKTHHHAVEPSKLSSEVFYLQRLGRQLAAAAAPAPASAAPSFVQVSKRADRDGGAGSEEEGGEEAATARARETAAGVLLADKQDLLRAKAEAIRRFSDEEAQLVDLINTQREELTKLEANLEEQRPVLADKVKQAAETGRTLAMSERVIERDQRSLNLTGQVCQIWADGAKTMNQLRFEAIGLVKMPAKLIYSMDTAMFLAKDLQALKAGGPPSFMQLGVTMGLGQAVQEALRVAAGAEEAYAPPPVPAGGDSAADGGSADGSSAGAGASFSQQGASEVTAGPFDKVIDMIRALMSSLKDQGNQDTDLNQWCLDSKLENDRVRVETKASEEGAAAQMIWAQAAIAKLDDQIKFFQAEITRLVELEKQVRASKDKEEKLIAGQLSDHKAGTQVLEKVVEVLKGLCDLEDKDLKLVFLQGARKSVRGHPGTDDPPVVLIQRSGSSKSLLTKHGQCTEAAKLLLEAVQKLRQLDAATKDYISHFSSTSAAEANAARDAAAQRNTDLTSATAAKAKRANELATAEGDRKQKKRDLSLVEKAAVAIAQKCSVRETHEERMARRNDEINALKSALRVMNGEEVPVDMSLVATGSSGSSRRDGASG